MVQAASAQQHTYSVEPNSASRLELHVSLRQASTGERPTPSYFRATLEHSSTIHTRRKHLKLTCDARRRFDQMCEHLAECEGSENCSGICVV
jgi:hypothetical protein